MDYKRLYSEAHDNAKHLPGYTCKRYAKDIAALVERFKPESLLDYASGKGYQYLALRLHEKWGGLLPHCYDIGVRQLSEKPARRFDGVINVDMLEHIAEPDLDGILREILGYAEKFAFLAVSCRPSRKRFPDGTNYHVTVKPPEWWEAKILPLVPEGLYVARAYELPDDAGIVRKP